MEGCATFSQPEIVQAYRIVSHRVYIDADGTIFDAALNQTNVGNNNNKV